jgi:hypothetical protein
MGRAFHATITILVDGRLEEVHLAYDTTARSLVSYGCVRVVQNLDTKALGITGGGCG